MHGNRQQKAARFEGEPGGGTMAARLAEASACSPSAPNVPENPDLVKFNGPIPTASGGAVCWGIADSLFTLRNVLKARGLDCPYEALVEAWVTMIEQATYIPRRQRRAVLKEVAHV